jgi:predicted enzyme related to lactoylglutathione lyase
MVIKGFHLAWIVVKDLKQAVDFYTNTIGLKCKTLEEKYGWAELTGEEGGALLGIAQKSDHESIQPGQNAVVTLTVENLEASKADLENKGAKMQGGVIEVPGNVRLQMVVDRDGNHFQLVQLLKSE